MAWVITRLCRDCVNQSCVDVCPADCIYEYKGSDKKAFPNQLYIHPEECISCGACEPECPWQAIYPEENVPEVFKDDIALNVAVKDRKAEFAAASRDALPKPSLAEVEANKKKWGFSG